MIDSELKVDQLRRPAVDPKAICQVEIQSTNLPQSQKFYAEVFGWLSSAAELYDCVVLDVPKDCAFGISLVPSQGGANSRTQVVLYFTVTGAADIAQRAVEWGGSKKFGPTKLPAYGNIWQITDPDGHSFGLFERQVSTS